MDFNFPFSIINYQLARKEYHMYIIVGLGNLGLQYQETRHNVGFRVIDHLAKELNIDVSKKKYKGLIGEGTIQREKIALVKPQTYMNLSGECIIEALNWYKVPLSNLIIIYDDCDLSLGDIRIREKGSAGTHNGMRSIISYLQQEDFPRVRIGIGKPENPDYELADYVTGKFLPEEKPIIDTSIKNAAEAVKMIVEEGISMAMNQYN
jgi:PTH1 family peptidyl-tRNA hydrolase